MISEKTIIALFNDMQAKNIICREFDLKPINLAKMIAAMANSFDGYIIIGASRDETGYLVNGISSRFNYQAALYKAQSILNAQLEIDTSQIVLDGKNLIVFKVCKSKKLITISDEIYILENNEITKVKGDHFMDKTKVFVVHGHDNAAKQETARFVEKLGFEAIILHEQVSKGKTIIEKIEEYSNVGFAIILYTPCDDGKSKKENKHRNRARQNVVFEHGFLIGKIGRHNVCALVKGDIEKPNDISGVVYVEMDSFGAWKNALADEMKESGYVIDKNKI